MRPVPPTGHWHEDYERGRPGWPDAALEVVQIPLSAAVLELGAGTGKLTRLLAARFAHVLTVEPDPDMRRILAAVGNATDVRAGSAEAIPASDRSVDAVFAAEAFHWFDGERALPEIARVLRPRGALVLLWNVPAGPVRPPIAEAEELLLRHAPPRDELGHDPLDLNADRFASGAWREPFADSAFERLREARIPNPQTLDRDALVAFFESMGWLGDLPAAERRQLVEQVRSLLRAREYRRTWEARVHWTRLAR